MRDSAFRAAAVILGVLGIPSVIWQAYHAWPPDQMGLYFFAGEALILFVFLGYGLGFGPMKSVYQASQPKEPGVEELPAEL